MQTADAYTTDELYREVADLAREQGVAGQEMWNELVEEVVDAHLDLGELTDDENLENIKAELADRWHEYEVSAVAAARGGTAEEDAGESAG
ncbi:MAG: hypothetical protein HYV42_01755 [Candidatus Magasanikbacteria bacterium]|nr:hypothetical protein [Candidatus Magasanikbacteria bacterium]